MAIEANPLPQSSRDRGALQATRAAAASELVGRACAMVQASADGRPPSLAGLARRLGVSPFQLHRAFRATLDISPKQYAEALRAGRLKTLLRDNQPVTAALYEAGYGSSSRLYERSDAELGMTPDAYRRGGSGMHIHYIVVRSALGHLLVAATERGVCSIKLGDTAARTRGGPPARVPERDDRPRPRPPVPGGDEPAGLPGRPAAAGEPAARRSRHRVRAARLAVPPADPPRPDPFLRRRGAGHRSAGGGARRRAGVRGQPRRARHPLPPCRAGERRRRAAIIGERRASSACWPSSRGWSAPERHRRP